MILDLFPTRIYKTTYPKMDELKNTLFPKLQEVFAQTQQNNQSWMRDSTLCSYNVASTLHREFPNETKDIVEFLESAAKEYWKECGYYEGLEPYVLEMWANETPTGGWVESHLHGPIPFTGVVYVDASPEQGNLVIDNPMEMVLMSQPINPAKEYSLGKQIEVNTGDVVLFPGYIKHRVMPNTTNRNRLILGVNFGSKGSYWTGQWSNGSTS
jgi:uncharacterized protein (TIGR02466 family)